MGEIEALEHFAEGVPEVHRVVGWYIALALVAAVVLMAVARYLKGEAKVTAPIGGLSVEDLNRVVQGSIEHAVNGHIRDLAAQIERLAVDVRDNRHESDKRHEENVRKFADIEAHLKWGGPGGRPWRPGDQDRRAAPRD